MRAIKVLKRICTVILLISIATHASSQENRKKQIETEIEQVEARFMGRVAEKGIAEAFVYYAADDAVINRNDSLIKGKDAIREFYGKPTEHRDIELNWKPEFIDVAESGELAYSFGYYTYSFTNKNGERFDVKGVFQTIWKRQKDGEWKFVYD